MSEWGFDADPFFLLPKCDLDGCDEQVRGFFDSGCCESHERALRRHAIEGMEALREGREPPERPTASEVDARSRRASKWSPDRMADRIGMYERAFGGPEWYRRIITSALADE